jgi:hypothetical protein
VLLEPLVDRGEVAVEGGGGHHGRAVGVAGQHR